jgi:hypothetical protein
MFEMIEASFSFSNIESEGSESSEGITDKTPYTLTKL